MKLKSALPAATVAACLAFAGTSHAVVSLQPSSTGASPAIAETGDAGDLPATAQPLGGFAGTDYSNISGSTTATNGFYDSDMFQITVGTELIFTFSNVSATFTPGVNTFDSQLALFDAAGIGIAVNDDAASGSSQSSVTSDLAAGTYYLLISGSGRYAVDANGNLIFPNLTDGTTDPSGTYGPESLLPIAGYTGATNDGGGYNIFITTMPSTAVPEPASWAGVLVGVAGLGLYARARRRALAAA